MRNGRPLTPRERDVLICRCGHDLTLTDTAKELGITRVTVNELSQRAFQRLGARSIAGACFRFGLRGAYLAVVARDGEKIA